jgi:hypothetical protein
MDTRAECADADACEGGTFGCADGVRLWAGHRFSFRTGWSVMQQNTGQQRSHMWVSGQTLSCLSHMAHFTIPR